MTLISVLAYLALVAGVYRLAKLSLGSLAAVCTTVLLLSRFHFAFYAALAYLDITYLALLVWAVALEVARPRRGGAVWALLIAAGLLRPDAWLYPLTYAAWLAYPRSSRRAAARKGPQAEVGGPHRTRNRRLAHPFVRLLALVALPAVTWGLLDLIVTGSPTFSFTFSTGDAASLSRTEPLYKVPWSIVYGLDDVTRVPVMVAGVAGLLLAWRYLPRSRFAVPAVVLAAGTISFGLTTAVGFSVVYRYLAFAAFGLVLFAGWLVAELLTVIVARARASPTLAGAAALALLAGAVWTALHLHPAGATGELSYRTHIERSLDTVVHSTTVADRCGPLSTPNHKLVPLIALDLKLDPETIIARSDMSTHRRSGVAIVVAGGNRLLYHNAYGPFGNDSHDPRSINDPPAGFNPVGGGNGDFHLYARCRS